MDDGLAHITSVQSSCNPEEAFHCLSDLNQIPEWNFNLAEVRMVESHLAEGVLKLIGNDHRRSGRLTDDSGIRFVPPRKSINVQMPHPARN